MSVFKSAKFWRIALVAGVALVLLQQIWHWEVELVEVPAGKFLVRTHRWGKDLPQDTIIAPDDSYKGVMPDVLSEGWHSVNPLIWSYKLEDAIVVPPTQRLVLIRQSGKDIPESRLKAGDFLARQDDERGVLPGVSQPGTYKLNPYAYTSERVEGVQIGVDQVGVRTLKVGLDPATLDPPAVYCVPKGYRGVQRDYVPTGTYWPNPYEETVTPIDIRSHLVVIGDIKFPSRDGFTLKPIVKVEYAVQPDRAPELLVRLSDHGKVHQLDSTDEEQKNNEVLQKIILPHIRGYARLEGSNFDARAFILTASDPLPPPKDGKPPAKVERTDNAREVLQKRLFKRLKEDCAKFGIEIRSATIADMPPPNELATQIADRELARVEQSKNKARLSQFKTEQDLQGAMALKKQATDKVQAQTRLVQATTQSQQMVEVAESRLKQELQNAQIKLEASKKQAEAQLATGKAEAAVINLQNEAEVSGLKKTIQGFSNVQDFARYQMVSRLAPALGEVFSSDDGEFAKIFAGLMSGKPADGDAKKPLGDPKKSVAQP